MYEGASWKRPCIDGNVTVSKVSEQKEGGELRDCDIGLDGHMSGALWERSRGRRDENVEPSRFRFGTAGCSTLKFEFV